MSYLIKEVGGIATAEVLRYLNKLEPKKFPPLDDRHLRDGHWWLARGALNEIVGFAGLVPMTPFRNVGYFKRAFVVEAHRGNGLQAQFIQARINKAVELGWHTLVSECAADNHVSARNFEKAGFSRANPEQCWGASESIYFVKYI